MLNVVWWVALALAMYVLSVGPVARYYKNRLPPPAVQAFYAPLFFLSDHVRLVEKVFQWYVKIWKKDN